MSQTKWGSFVEAWANILVGFSINFFANLAILPIFGFNVTGGQAFWIGVLFTGISLIRSYVLRRWFNGLKFGNRPEVELAVAIRTDFDVVKFVAVREGGWVTDLRCTACEHSFTVTRGEPMPANCPVCLQ